MKQPEVKHSGKKEDRRSTGRRSESALILNKLPNSSVAILTMSICGCSLKESYKHVILGTMIPAAAAGLVIALMATFGITF